MAGDLRGFPSAGFNPSGRYGEMISQKSEEREEGCEAVISEN